MSVAIVGAAVAIRAPVAVGGATVIVPSTPDGPSLAHLPEPIRVRAARTERLPQLVLAAGGAALASAARDAADAGIVVGTTFGCFLTNAAYQRRIGDEGPGAASPRLFAATVSNAAAGELAIAYGLAAPSVTVTAGAAAGLAALGHAADLVAGGRARAIVAVAADASGAALADWVAAGGLPDAPAPVDAAVALVLEDGGRARGSHGTLEAHALRFAPPGDARDVVPAVVADALASAGVPARDVACLAGTARGVAAARGRVAADARVVVPDAADAAWAAGAPLALLAALAVVAPGAPVVVVEACPTGHVAAVVARRSA